MPSSECLKSLVCPSYTNSLYTIWLGTERNSSQECSFMRYQSKYEVQSGENRYGDESLEDVQDGCLRFVATEQIFHVNSLVI